MIVFADNKLLKTVMTRKSALMSFMSFAGFPIVRNLIPPMEIGELYYQSLEDYPNTIEAKENAMVEFRSKYLQFLCGYLPFLGIMEVMMIDFYNPDGVIIITDLNSDMVTNMIECISQFIYDRWHYNTAIVNEPEDFDSLNLSEIPPEYINVFNADKVFYLNHIKETGDGYFE